MSGMRGCKLGDVIKFGNGKSRPLSEGEYPIYGGNGILGYSAETNYNGETIIIGRVGAYCGSTYYENRPIWVSDNALSAKPKDKNDAKYFFYLLNNMDLNQHAQGSSHPLVTQTLLNSINVEIIEDAVEQKSIASILSCLDDKIDLLHRQNQTLEVLAETLFRQWFVEDTRDREGGEISCLIDFNPQRKLTKGDTAPYLGMAALGTNTFNPDGWYDREFSSGTKFTNGDTLLARITPCLENGKTAYVTFMAENQVGWGSTEFIVMRPIEVLHPFFAYVLARDHEFREYAESCMAGSSGRQRVDIGHLKKYAVGKLTNVAIDNFNNLAESIEPKLHANMVQIKTLKKLRDSLLPKLMSGEIRVAV